MRFRESRELEEFDRLIHSVKKRWLSIIIGLVLGSLAYMWPLGLTQPEQAVLGIIFFAATLWFTEAIPLWTTALIVPPLLVVLAGLSPSEVYTPFFDPIIALLFGGFILARGLQKHRLDFRIAAFFIRIFGNKPRMFLLGLMVAAAFLSFWISNTASTLLMIPIGLAALTATGLKPLKSRYSKTVVLGIGYAATIGGVGTLIGTPPNLIAVRMLAESGIHVDFLGWMMYAMPLVVIMIGVAWVVLSLLNKPEIKEVKAPVLKEKKMDRNQKIVLWTFFLTALLWVTETFHGIHNSVIAMIPLAVFYLTNVLDTSDLPKIGWDALILIGGGLSLGVAIHSTGLDLAIAGALGGSIANHMPYVTLALLALFSIAFTAFVANTAGSAILVPIIIPLAPLLGFDPRVLAVLVGIAVSFDFIVPVGTAPNAIAYSTGYIRVKDMIKSGALISIIGGLLVALFSMFW